MLKSLPGVMAGGRVREGMVVESCDVLVVAVEGGCAGLHDVTIFTSPRVAQRRFRKRIREALAAAVA